MTYSPSRALNLYVGYSEGSRAATSIELGCADPDEPCKLPNAMAGDPPLDQVVTRTFEGGRARPFPRRELERRRLQGRNRDDILFVTSEQTGFGYFRNFGETRRQGIELGASGRVGRVTLGAGYTYLNATFESEETVNGESNSTNDAAEDGARGLEGTIEIEPGDRMPFIPSHMLKAYGDIEVTSRLSLDLESHRGVELVCARQREQPARARRRVLPRAGRRRPATPSSISGHLPAQAVDPGHRADQQPVRSSLLHRRPTRANWVHGDRRISSRGPFPRRWRVPRPAVDVLRARRAAADVDRRAGHVLTEGLRPSDSPTGSLAGTPAPRAAHQAARCRLRSRCS